MAFMDIDSKLSDERIRESELRQGIHGNRKLADANETDAELRNGDHPAGELANRNNAPGRHRDTVWPVLEGNVQQGQPQQRGLGFVFKTPSIPLVFRRERSAATGTGRRLLGNLVLAFPARFHNSRALISLGQTQYIRLG